MWEYKKRLEEEKKSVIVRLCILEGTEGEGQNRKSRFNLGRRGKEVS